MSAPDPNPSASALARRAAVAAFAASRNLNVVDRTHKRRHPTAAQREKQAKLAIDRLETALHCARATLDELTRERTALAKKAGEVKP